MKRNSKEELEVNRNRKYRIIPRRIAQGVAAAALCSGAAHAFEIPTGNENLNVRWDNTVKYNAGWRIDERDRKLGDSWGMQGGEHRFDQGEMVTNRVDLLSEFDFIYNKHHGFRISGAAWYDAAYDRDVEGNPAYQRAGLGTAFPRNRLTDSVARPYTSSGEILDAFVFGRLELGGRPIDMKAGRHTVYWGESLFSPIHGVSYSQGPVDFRKALATPGSEAKELFLPLNQLSFAAQVTDKLSIAGQYFLEWKPYRLSEGSTYFNTFDPLFQRGTNFLGIPYHGNLKSGPHEIPDDTGSWGINAKLATDLGTFGVYYRRFDDKLPAVLSTGGTFGELHNAYAEDVKLIGVSMSTLVGGTAIGAEIVHRKDTALNTAFGSPEIARGDTWHALANAIAYIGKTAAFDSATLLAELTYSRLQSLDSKTKAFYSGVGHACADSFGGRGGRDDGCSTRDAWGFGMTFTPTWFSALPQTDITMPIHFDTGISGNSPVPAGGNEGNGSWSLGVGFDYQARYKLDIAYTDYFGSYNKGPNPLAFVPGISPVVMGTASGGMAPLHDRGWLSVTFKTTF